VRHLGHRGHRRGLGLVAIVVAADRRLALAFLVVVLAVVLVVVLEGVDPVPCDRYS